MAQGNMVQRYREYTRRLNEFSEWAQTIAPREKTFAEKFAEAINRIQVSVKRLQESGKKVEISIHLPNTLGGANHSNYGIRR